MKKKILTTLLAAALLVSGVSVFAEEAADTSANETAVATSEDGVIGSVDEATEISISPEATPAPTEAPDFTKVTKLTVADKEIGAVSYDSELKTVLVPVRAVAEALGYEVNWDGDLRAVTVGTEQMGVNFVIGENSYKKSKMTPFVLEAAPVIINDYTYVPVSFFSDVLEADITVSDTDL